MSVFQQRRFAILLVVFMFIVTKASSQRFYAVVFDKLPQDYQLYPRNESNLANVPVKGIIEFKDWNYMSVQVLRNGKPYVYKKAPITYLNGGNGTFGVEIPIKAELAEYDFLVYAVKSPDSVLMVKRKNVVAGDVFLVSGQSNSYNGSENSRIYKGEFARSFGYMVDYTNFNPYNPVDTLWDLANNRAKVGLWASEFQRLVIEKQQVPVCIINGGSGGSSMQYNLLRTNDPADLNTSSGRLYYRVKKAGLLENVKAFIYRQGEFEANDNSGALAWKESMIKHIEALKREYPGLKHFYIPQINVLEGTQVNQGLVRESQRQLTTTNSLIKGYATIGTKGYDGIHYSPDGHFQSAAELYRIVASSQYGDEDKLTHYSPNIKRAYYSTPDKINVVLEFDQSVIVQSDTTVLNQVGKSIVRKIGENFGFSAIKYPANNEWIIQHVKASDNKVLIQLFEPPKENLISYIPTNHSTAALGPFAGPFIKNSAGMRAFAFQNIPIEDPPTPKILESKVVFNQLPQDYQVFPRDTKTNLGHISVSGMEGSGNFVRISMIILRGQSKVFYTSANLTYQNGSAPFNISGPILAEKLNYGLRVYLVNSKNDSTLIAARNEIVSGDILVINGNKHVSNGFLESNANQFIRTFGSSVLANIANSPYPRADTLWSIANTSRSNNIGKLAFMLSSNIIDKSTFPIAIINAADNFTTTSQLTTTTPQLTTNLDKLTYRIQKARVGDHVRGYYFQGGELDTQNDMPNWGGKMNQHLTEIKKLMPNLSQVFVGQLNLESDSLISAQIRELQRKIPNVITIPTYGITGFDGFNYTDVGLSNLSSFISNHLLAYLFNQNTLPKYSYPNLLKAIQSVKAPSKILLIFDTNSNLKLAPLPKGKLLSFFKLDQKQGKLTDIEAQGNQLVLTLKSPSKSNTISFLSSGIKLFEGVPANSRSAISNTFGQEILTFDQFPIQQALPALNVKLQSQAHNKIIINWDALPFAKQYKVERKGKASPNFQQLNQLSADQLTYSDLNPPLGGTLLYRVFALSDSSESEESNSILVTIPDSLAPLNPKIQSKSFTSITLTWEKMVAAKGYLISKKSAQGAFTQIAQSEENSFTDSGLLPNTLHEYKIAYFTVDGISKFANIKERTEIVLSNEPSLFGLTLFPNPTSNVLNFKWDQAFSGSIIIYNVLGEKVDLKQLSSALNYQIDLSKYNVGTYLLEINDVNVERPMNILKVIRQD